MSFWGVLLALLWDQVSPLFRPAQMERLFGRYTDWLWNRVNAGTRAHGLLAWVVAVLPVALLAAMLAAVLTDLAWLLGLAWSALVLYRCLGMRQAVDQVRDLAAALNAGDVARARDRLAGLGVAADPAEPESIRLALERMLQLALERMFGVLFWFVVLGVFGALAYALTRMLAARWQGHDEFHAVITQIAYLMDWLPARLLAFSFAIVGNFEEAMVAWRSRVADGDAFNEGVVRAAGLGALGIEQDGITPAHLEGVAGLINRAELLWLGVLGLLWLGSL